MNEVYVPVLLSLLYSPWSERARWAIEHHRLDVQRRTYEPILGELELRRRLGRWSGPVSVPVLIDDDGKTIEDSTAIARWADERGNGTTLFPRDDDAAIADWIACADRAMNAGRVLSLRRMLANPEALAEMVPKKTRAALPFLAVSLGRFGVARTLRKYAAASSGDDPARIATQALLQLRDGLAAAVAAGHSTTLLRQFSYADVAMAQALVFISPPAFGVKVGAASRRSFTDPELAPRFADLIAWRDALYDAHRPRV